MPIFRVQVNYTKDTVNKWSNVWHVSAATITDAAAAFETEGVPNLLGYLHNDCQLASLLVSDEAGSAFITVPINAAGTSLAADGLLPLFNSMKVFFQDGSLGRPDYKYIKGYLTEAFTEDGIVAPAVIAGVVTAFGTLISDMVAAGAPLVSEDNDQYISANGQPAVQMRQMHRKRKKTVTP
jgi:hypothetical protein